jgi:hypothetical protein
MATNSRFFRLFFAVFIFLGLSSVFAQNSGYFINTEGGEPRVVQRLAWSGEFALRYEAIIANRVGVTYRNYHSEFTSELYIDISLQPGSYRFRVIPYDILNRPGVASEWKYIEVLPALQPEPIAALPEYVTGGAGEEPSGFLLNITGYNLDPKAEVFIRRSDGTQVAAETLASGDGGSIRAFVDSDIVISGEYEIIVRNPGGLEAGIGGVPLLLPEPETEIYISEEESEDSSEPELFPLRPVIFSAGLALMPSFPVYGDCVKGGMAVYGLTARVNLLFYIPIGVYIGPELSAMAFLGNYPDENGEYFLYNLNPENIPDRFTLMVGVNLLVRKWFPGRRAALSFRAGADYGILPDWIDQISIKMDISFLFRFTNSVMMEGGLDYSHLISDISGGFFRPWLGIGFQF